MRSDLQNVTAFLQKPWVKWPGGAVLFLFLPMIQENLVNLGDALGVNGLLVAIWNSDIWNWAPTLFTLENIITGALGAACYYLGLWIGGRRLRATEARHDSSVEPPKEIKPGSSAPNPLMGIKRSALDALESSEPLAVIVEGSKPSGLGGDHPIIPRSFIVRAKKVDDGFDVEAMLYFRNRSMNEVSVEVGETSWSIGATKSGVVKRSQPKLLLKAEEDRSVRFAPVRVYEPRSYAVTAKFEIFFWAGEENATAMVLEYAFDVSDFPETKGTDRPLKVAEPNSVEYRGTASS